MHQRLLLEEKLSPKVTDEVCRKPFDARKSPANTHSGNKKWFPKHSGNH